MFNHRHPPVTEKKRNGGGREGKHVRAQESACWQKGERKGEVEKQEENIEKQERRIIKEFNSLFILTGHYQAIIVSFIQG